MAFFTTNDGVKINFHDYGRSEAPALVLIGGYSSSEVTWAFQLKPLTEAGFRVITYDHRNHGASERVTYGLTIHRLAEDLQELLQHLQLEKPVLIGHSMGSATIMAYEELFTSQGLSAVITEDQAPIFLKMPDWLDGRFGKEIADLPQFMADFPRTRLTKKSLSDTVKRELGRGMLPFDFRANQNLLRNVIMQDWRPTLAQETRPHLFLAGEKSPIFPAEHAAAARALQPNAHSDSKIFAGCGHIPHLEAIEEFNQTLIDFIRKNAFY